MSLAVFQKKNVRMNNAGVLKECDHEILSTNPSGLMSGLNVGILSNNGSLNHVNPKKKNWHEYMNDPCKKSTLTIRGTAFTSVPNDRTAIERLHLPRLARGRKCMCHICSVPGTMSGSPCETMSGSPCTK